MDNYQKTIYNHKSDSKYMPHGLDSFGAVALSQPLVSCLYSGFVSRFGLDNLQIIKQLAEACSDYSSVQVKIITLKADKLSVDESLQAIQTNHQKLREQISKKSAEIQECITKFNDYHTEDNDAGMLVNSDRITVKIKDIQEYINKKRDLAGDSAKLELQARKLQTDIDTLVQKVDKLCIQIKKLLEVFSVKTVDNIQLFANGDPEETEKIFLNGVALVNQKLPDNGPTVKIEDAKIKLAPFVKFVQHYFKCLFTYINYVSSVYDLPEEQITKSKLMTIKRYKALVDSFVEHLAGARGIKLVYSNFPSVLNMSQRGAFKLFNRQINISLNDSSSANLMANREQALAMVDKNSDAFVVSVATAIDDLCTKNFDLSAINAMVNQTEQQEQQADDTNIEQQEQTDDSNVEQQEQTNKELSAENQQMQNEQNPETAQEDLSNLTEQPINEQQQADGTMQNQNAVVTGTNMDMQGAGAVVADPSLMGQMQQPMYDPNSMGQMQQPMYDPNTMGQMQQPMYDPNLMGQNPNPYGYQ